MKKRVEIFLTDEEMEFVKWMAKRDGVTIQRELQQYFYTEFEQCKVLYMDEMMEEQG